MILKNGGKNIMKKLLITTIILLMAVGSYAADYATDEGSMMLGGVIGFSAASGDLYIDDQSTIIFMPSISYFIIPGLAIGPILNIISESEGDSSLTTLGLGLKGAYYIGDQDSSVYPYLGIAFTYNSISMDDGTNETKMTGISIMPAGGIAIMLCDKISLNVELGYSIDSRGADEGDSVSGGVFQLLMGVSGYIF